MGSRPVKILDLKGNFMKLDGGSMFGNAPKALWQTWMKPDENNMIDIGSRSLLIEDSEHRILFETGAGAYLSPDMKKRFSIQEKEHILLKSLKENNISHRDITHVVLSHLHFDHAGGLFDEWKGENESLKLLFPNAEFVTGRSNFERSCSPHLRDRASFIPELPGLLKKSKRLVLVEDGDTLKIGNIIIDFFESEGHTPGMLISDIQIHELRIFFMADLIPGIPWINLPITMGYDRSPELLINEKLKVLEKAYKDNVYLFFAHDPVYAASKLGYDKDRNRYVPEDPEKSFKKAVGV